MSYYPLYFYAKYFIIFFGFYLVWAILTYLMDKEMMEKSK